MVTTKLDVANVASVYIGEPGACCCGCSGDHFYASQHLEWASKDLGYPVRPEWIDDNKVLEVVKLMNERPLIWEDEREEMGYVSIEWRGDLYVAYIKHD